VFQLFSNRESIVLPIAGGVVLAADDMAPEIGISALYCRHTKINPPIISAGLLFGSMMRA